MTIYGFGWFVFSSRRRHTICALVTGVRRVLFRSNDAQRIADLVSSKYSRAATQEGSFASDRPSNSFSASAGPRPGTAKLAFSSGMNTEVAMRRLEGRLSDSPAAFIDHFPAGNITILPFGSSDEHTSDLQSLMRTPYSIYR